MKNKSKYSSNQACNAVPAHIERAQQNEGSAVGRRRLSPYFLL